MSDERSEAGIQFHVVGPLTAKLRWPIVVLERGTSSIPDDAESQVLTTLNGRNWHTEVNQVARSYIVEALPLQYRRFEDDLLPNW